MIKKVIMGSTNITIEDIKKIFQDMFKQNQEAITKKQEEMFRSEGKPGIYSRGDRRKI